MSVQISAYIQDDVKVKMEQYTSMNGIKKAFLIENAIEHYLQAMHEIPNGIIVPSSISVDTNTFENIMDLESKNPSTKLTELLS